VVLIKQYERNSKQLNFILNQINVIIYSYKHSIKKYLPRFFFKFYQPKATGGGFLIFEWTLSDEIQQYQSKSILFIKQIKEEE
jgi:hypothetical protein